MGAQASGEDPDRARLDEPTRLGEMLDGADIDLDKQDWWDLYVAAGNLIP